MGCQVAEGAHSEFSAGTALRVCCPCVTTTVVWVRAALGAGQGAGTCGEAILAGGPGTETPMPGSELSSPRGSWWLWSGLLRPGFQKGVPGDPEPR